MAALSQTCGPLWLEAEPYNYIRISYFSWYILPAIYYVGTYEPQGTHLLMALNGFFLCEFIELNICTLMTSTV